MVLLSVSWGLWSAALAMNRAGVRSWHWTYFLVGNHDTSERLVESQSTKKVCNCRLLTGNLSVPCLYVCEHVNVGVV